MDISPLLHALCAVAAQILVGLFTGNWAYGAIAGCTFFIAREHTQAEYRWIEMFGHGKRMNMPWWGGFDPRAWDVASLMDFAVPVVACLLVWLLVNRGGKKGSCICNGGRNPVAGSQEKVSGVAVLGCCANWVITDPVYGSFPFCVR